MAGGDLLAYGAITTKIKAMHSNLLTSEQFNEIAHCQSVSEVLAYLQKTPAYNELFVNIDPSTIHRGQIEWLLNFSTYKDYSKIFHFAMKNQRDYLNLYFMRYEIFTLKRYMRTILDHRESTSVSIIENDFEKHSGINTKKVASSENMEEFIDNLAGSIYYNALAKFKKIEGATLFDYETALDMFFFSTLWKEKDKISSKSERDFITKSYGSRIDLLNILWIYRCKSYYSVSNSAMYSYLIPIRYKLKKADIKQLVEAENPQQILEYASKTYYGKKYGFNNDSTLEEQCNSIIDGIIFKEYKKNPYSLASVSAYFHSKNAESAKLITALECIRYQYPPERVLQYINGKGSGV